MTTSHMGSVTLALLSPRAVTSAKLGIAALLFNAPQRFWSLEDIVNAEERRMNTEISFRHLHDALELLDGCGSKSNPGLWTTVFCQATERRDRSWGIHQEPENRSNASFRRAAGVHQGIF